MIVTDAEIQKRLPAERAADANKYSFGKLQLIAGTQTYPGAARLSALGAFKAGCGYVCLETEVPIEILRDLPEVVPGFHPECSAFVVGPGLDAKYPFEKIQQFLREIPSDKPLLIDGGALRHIAQLNLLGRCSVVATPHEGELAQILGSEWPASRIRNDREAAAQAFTKRYPGIVLLLKGAPSLILGPDAMWTMNRGNASMSSAGQGDLLSGVIGAYLALGLPAVDATILGSFLCALAAEDLSSEGEAQGILAHEIAQYLPILLKQLRSAPATSTV